MRTSLVALLAAATLALPVFAKDENSSVKRLAAATTTLTEMMSANDKGIPQELLDKAHCVVVIPGLKKAGFIVGGKYGKGFATCRKASGAGWTAPAAMRIEGGSFGLQIGASETDVILLIMNQSGVDKLLKDKFTIGADAAAAAGPIGRDLSAQTDAMMRAEILSYSRSRGVFAGLTLSGATLRPDEEDNRDLYGRAITAKEILSGAVDPPAAAASFQSTLTKLSMRKGK